MTTTTENKCRYCGHPILTGEVCIDKRKCAGRVLIHEATEAIMEYGCIPQDLDAGKIAEEIITKTIKYVWGIADGDYL